MKKLIFFLLTMLSIHSYAQRYLSMHRPVHDVQNRQKAVNLPVNNPVNFNNGTNAARRPMENVYFYENFDNGIPSSWTVNGSWRSIINSDLSLNDSPYVFTDYMGDLESPVINISNPGTPVYLSFDHYFYYVNTQDVIYGDIEVYDGNAWVLLARYEHQNYGIWGNPLHEVFDVSSYINPSFKVRFHFQTPSSSDCFWTVDNVKMFTPNAHDLTIASWGIPQVAVPNEEAYFSTIVYNNGSNTENVFDVHVEVFDASNNTVHDETVHITSANLNPGKKWKVNFTGTWIPPGEGNYTVRYTVMLPGDEDASNDIYEYTVPVRNFRYESGKVYSFANWGYNFGGPSIPGEHIWGYFDINSGIFTTIDTVFFQPDYDLTGGDFIDFFQYPVLVVVGKFYNHFFFVNGDGTHYKYGNIPFLYDQITGLTFNRHGSSYFTTKKSLYKLTPWLDTVKIGDYNTSSRGISAIAMDSSGNLFGVEEGYNRPLYSIDTTNAHLTPIGALEIVLDYYYSMDIGFDKEQNLLYGTFFAYDLNFDEAVGLHSINTNTGEATYIYPSNNDEYNTDFGVCAYAPSNVLKTEQNEVTEWNLYPNPAGDVLHIRWKTLPDTWQIIDINGKIWLEGTFRERQQNIDVSRLPAGTYWVKIRQGKSISTQPFLKK